MIALFGNKQLRLPYGCLINRLLSRLEIPVYEENEYATPIKPFTKKTVSQNRAHVKGESSRTGFSSIGDADLMVEEAKIDAATVGTEEPNVPPRTMCDQVHRFE